MNVAEYHRSGIHIRYDADIFSNFEEASFNSKIWAQRSAIVGFAEGRGTTFFIQHQGRDFVLRHYQRGGLATKFSVDRYIYLGLRFTRPWREWALLTRMLEKGLPVPVPAAIKVERHGLLYAADIMMLRIPGARSLMSILMGDELTEGYWIAIGSMIRRFHEQGVYHADLNANNIMLDEGGRCYLIDFDRCKIKKPALKWQKENLLRLKRSLNKISANNEVFYFVEENWRSLLRGYGWEDLKQV